jgi:CelD/BcsL family acetyltransferase involved in cellulose biosynthesis
MHGDQSRIPGQTSESLTIQLNCLPHRAVLEEKWLSLESRSDCSYFVSWSWIGCWLDSLPQYIEPSLIEVSDGTKIVALGLLVQRAYRRRFVLPVAGAFLNTTGVAALDAVTIEYNDLLVDRSSGDTLRHQVVQSLLAPGSGIEEFSADGMLASAEWARFAPAGFSVSEREEICRSVDLRAVRTRGDFLALLSANTRSNVRRSHKEFAKLGKIKIEAASDLDMARSMYSTLQQLHGEYWSSRGQKGVFSNSFLREFHRQLIEARFAFGEIQLISIAVGSHIVGVLYNFVYRGRVYSYQSGFDYHYAGKQNRPGLVAHSLAIELNAQLGNDVYDFMAGDSQYKRSLSTHEASMRWVKFQKSCAKFRIENWFRHLKRGLA